MRKVLSVLLLAAIAAALATVASAQGAPAGTPAPPVATTTVVGGPRMGAMSAPNVLSSLRILQPFMSQMLATRLELTEDQQTKVNDLLTKADKEATPLVEAQNKASQEFIAALGKTATTQAELTALGDKATKSEKAVLDARIKTLFELRAMLTPEQNTKLNEMLAQNTSAWGGRSGVSAPGAPGGQNRPAGGGRRGGNSAAPAAQ